MAHFELPKKGKKSKHHWKGHWMQGGQKGEMECKLEISDDGKVKGKGEDKVGKFTWKGKITGGKIEMEKQYIGKHKVDYVGTFKSKKEMSGSWHIGGSSTGTFILKD